MRFENEFIISRRELILGSTALVALLPIVPAAAARPTHIVELITETPCLDCLRSATYSTHHWADDRLATRAATTDFSGVDIHELVYDLEHFTAHGPVGHCPDCGRDGMESSSVGLEHLSKVEFGRIAADASYEFHWIRAWPI